jgi:AcrR family transcriptional regulator
MDDINPAGLAKRDHIRSPRRRADSLERLKRAARELFVERGYHATRPQDITRRAGLGHGTFYLHFPDKRACFLDFVEDARTEMAAYIEARDSGNLTLNEAIANLLHAIYDYSESNPGVVKAALVDEAVIDTEGVQAVPLLDRWGGKWADFMRDAVTQGQATLDYDPAIVGQAIVGAVHQASSEGRRTGRKRDEVIDNLTRFLVRAIRI